jgi:hypothetical protein
MGPRGRHGAGYLSLALRLAPVDDVVLRLDVAGAGRVGAVGMA